MAVTLAVSLSKLRSQDKTAILDSEIIRSSAASWPTKLLIRIRRYEQSAVVFTLDLRPFAWDAVLRRLPDADAVAADLPGARRGLGLFDRGGLRHRRIRPLALGLHGTPAARCAHLAGHEVCRRSGLRDRRSSLAVASGALAEFDPRADATRCGGDGISAPGHSGCIGGFRNRIGACADVPPDAAFRGDES